MKVPGSPAALTVRDLLALPQLGTRLLACADAIDVPVRWAHSTELLDPRPYLSGGELVLTVGSSLRTDAQCGDFVEHLWAAGVVALGYGVGDVTTEVPPALVESCRSRGLPLLSLAHGVPFQTITELLADHRSQERVAGGRRVQQLVTDLLHAVATDRSLAELLDLVGVGLGGQVTYSAGALLWASEAPAPAPEVLRHVGAVLAVRQREHDQDAANRRREAGRLIQLVADRRADAEVLTEVLAMSGVPVSGPVVVAAWPAGSGPVLASVLGCALVAETDAATLTVTTSLQVEVAQEMSLPCGIAPPSLLDALPSVVPVALTALELSRRRCVPVTHRDLVTFPGLLELQPPERLTPFSETLVAPLDRHDREHGTALLQTLRAFLDGDGSVSLTASGLFLHPNSLRHRLRRISELTGCDPRSFDDRVALAVGLWAWDRQPRERR
ncbi:MAG: PucR family transcriptional regulator [Nocardioidaceae bacterium]